MLTVGCTSKRERAIDTPHEAATAEKATGETPATRAPRLELRPPGSAATLGRVHRRDPPSARRRALSRDEGLQHVYRIQAPDRQGARLLRPDDDHGQRGAPRQRCASTSERAFAARRSIRPRSTSRFIEVGNSLTRVSVTELPPSAHSTSRAPTEPRPRHSSRSARSTDTRDAPQSPRYAANVHCTAPALSDWVTTIPVDTRPGSFMSRRRSTKSATRRAQTRLRSSGTATWHATGP